MVGATLRKIVNSAAVAQGHRSIHACPKNGVTNALGRMVQMDQMGLTSRLEWSKIDVAMEAAISLG